METMEINNNTTQPTNGVEEKISVSYIVADCKEHAEVYAMCNFGNMDGTVQFERVEPQKNETIILNDNKSKNIYVCVSLSHFLTLNSCKFDGLYLLKPIKFTKKVIETLECVICNFVNIVDNKSPDNDEIMNGDQFVEYMFYLKNKKKYKLYWCRYCNHMSYLYGTGYIMHRPFKIKKCSKCDEVEMVCNNFLFWIFNTFFYSKWDGSAIINKTNNKALGVFAKEFKEQADVKDVKECNYCDDNEESKTDRKEENEANNSKSDKE